MLAVSHEATRTGAPIVLLRLLEWLRAHREIDIEVLLLKGGPLTAELEAVGPVHLAHAYGGSTLPEKVEKRLAKRRLGRVADASRLARLRRDVRHLRGFDLLYLNSMSSAVALRALPERPPTVVTHVHELDSALAHWIDPGERAEMLERSDAFVAAAGCVERALVDTYGVDPSRVHRCYEFVDPPEPDPARVEAARAALRLAPGELVVGAAGTADWRKGTDLFLQVAARIRRDAPDLPVRFVWVGRTLDHHQDGHEADLALAGLGDHVTFTGEVPDPESYMSHFDVFCLTSREDPYPLVCLEAAMLGVPVVTLANGGMVELAVAAGDDDPLLTAVPYLDVEAMAAAVVDLLRDRDRARRSGARLGAWVSERHVSAVGARDLAGVIDATLAAAGSPAVAGGSR